MADPLNLRDLELWDIPVLRDLVRFGVLANDQIERRYGDPSHAADRLAWLLEAGLVEAWSPLVQDTTAFSATTAGARVARCGLRATRPSLQHLLHEFGVEAITADSRGFGDLTNGELVASAIRPIAGRIMFWPG